MVLGLDSLAFLALYAGLSLAVWLANVLAWRWAAGRAAPDERFPPVGVYELALLNGGPKLAVDAAITTLHERGELREGWIPGTLAATGDRPPTTAQPLERELLDTLRRTRDARPCALAAELAGGVAMRELVARLIREGLLLAPSRSRPTALLWLWSTPALLLLGAVAIADGWDYGDKPMRWLATGVACQALHLVGNVNAHVQSDGRPLPTARGNALVAQRRASQPDAGEPGNASTAQSVALGGTSSLWSSAPELATLLGVVRESAADLSGDSWWSCGCG
jgi:uncharacterized protein (TIGR04222 family)